MAQFRLRVVKSAAKSGNVSEVARLFRVSRQSVHRWIARYDGTLESLKDGSHKPHWHPNQQTKSEVDMVLKVQRHNKRLGLVCLWVHLTQDFGYSRSVPALYKLLRRENIMRTPTKRRRHKSKPYEPILTPGARIQMDVKYVPRECLVGALSGKRLYQYTAIDECTRWRHVAIYEDLSTSSSVHFLNQVLARFPFEIECVQTDNGAEFTSRYTNAGHLSAFESALGALGIRHKLIAPATPRHNGKVERSHRSDQERFYNDNKFYSLRYIREQAAKYLARSNRFPLMAHKWKSAQYMLEAYQYVL